MLLFSRFYFLRHKYKGHDFLRAGAFAPVSPLPPQPRACFLNEFFIIWENVFVKTPSLLISPLLLSKLIFTSNSTFLKYVQFENNDFFTYLRFITCILNKEFKDTKFCEKTAKSRNLNSLLANFQLIYPLAFVLLLNDTLKADDDFKNRQQKYIK